MTQQEVEHQINTDFEKFQNEVYKGSVQVPENILDLFKKGIKAMVPQSHGIMASRIKFICSKDYSQLTVGDLEQVIKIIVNTPFGVTYSEIFERDYLMGTEKGNAETFNEAISEHVVFEKFILCFNNLIQEFTDKLKMKKANLINLTKGVSNNGLKIVPN